MCGGDCPGGHEPRGLAPSRRRLARDGRPMNSSRPTNFTSYELAQRLLADRGLALVGTVRKNKPELPPALLATKSRRVLSSAFAFTPTATLVSYLARRAGHPSQQEEEVSDVSVQEGPQDPHSVRPV
ncbi:hypothetical protein DPEC_G00095780 [Dallia pectoralis]|uniref:Uncharacterized protein n=1 Tax=Dallia pectoralis TaxID=75939 RepID=A0ACC2GVE3_DALPE|nr:hypothetical protein DPEC_G00095780 [Dallia pectoralis]